MAKTTKAAAAKIKSKQKTTKAEAERKTLLKHIKPYLDRADKTTLLEVYQSVASLIDAKEAVGRKHRLWIKDAPQSALADLLEYLESFQDELQGYNGEDLLADILPELGFAGEYFAEFELDDPEDQDVDYRIADVEEDIQEVQELIGILGEKYQVKQLPKWKPKRKVA